jgi:hypothetical protein
MVYLRKELEINPDIFFFRNIKQHCLSKQSCKYRGNYFSLETNAKKKSPSDVK